MPDLGCHTSESGMEHIYIASDRAGCASHPPTATQADLAPSPLCLQSHHRQTFPHSFALNGTAPSRPSHQGAEQWTNDDWQCSRQGQSSRRQDAPKPTAAKPSHSTRRRGPSPPAPPLLAAPASACIPAPPGALTAIPGPGNNIALTLDDVFTAPTRPAAGTCSYRLFREGGTRCAPSTA